MAADYGHFAKGSSGRMAAAGMFRESAAIFPLESVDSDSRLNQLTPSFFCKLEEEVVYWNTSRLSG